MAQDTGVRTAMSMHGYTWDERRLPTLHSLLNRLIPPRALGDRILRDTKAQENIPPEYPKSICAFRLSLHPQVHEQLPKGAKSKDQFMAKSLNEGTTQKRVGPLS